MTTPASFPRRIVLATDLSQRCDRALDRAAQLAQCWQAELLVVHALAPAAPQRGSAAQPTATVQHLREKVAAARLLKDLGLDLQQPRPHALRVRVEEADPAELVLRVVQENPDALVVTGLARDGLFGGVALGSTVETLLRRSPVPVLVVRNRARAAYGKVLVATDFSAASRPALLLANRLFPDEALNVFHAWRAPYEGSAAQDDARPLAAEQAAAEEGKRFLGESGLPADALQKLTLVLDVGSAEICLSRYVEEEQVQLLVLGSRGRSAMAEVLLGSVVKQILPTLSCDALVVPLPPAPR